MPEPESTTAEVAVPPTPPIETPSSRASFASCPPEEEREAIVSRVTARADTPLPQSPETSSAVDDDVDSDAVGDARIAMADVRQEPTPEPEARLGARRDGLDEREKGEREEDAGITVNEESMSAFASPEMRGEEGGEGRMARTAAEVQRNPGAERPDDGESAPLYLTYPPLQREKVRDCDQLSR